MQYLPCPFCGGVDIKVYEGIYDGLHIIVYCECGAQGGEAEDKEGAIALWNTRIKHPTNQEEK